jgi:hypothetical protein
MNWETVRLILTEELGIKIIMCQNRAKKSHRATARWTVERSF